MIHYSQWFIRVLRNSLRKMKKYFHQLVWASYLNNFPKIYKAVSAVKKRINLQVRLLYLTKIINSLNSLLTHLRKQKKI